MGHGRGALPSNAGLHRSLRALPRAAITRPHRPAARALARPVRDVDHTRVPVRLTRAPPGGWCQGRRSRRRRRPAPDASRSSPRPSTELRPGRTRPTSEPDTGPRGRWPARSATLRASSCRHGPSHLSEPGRADRRRPEPAHHRLAASSGPSLTSPLDNEVLQVLQPYDPRKRVVDARRCAVGVVCAT